MDQQAGLNIVLSMPTDAKGWRIWVKVYAVKENSDELVLTDQADLMSLTARKKMVSRIAEELHLDPKRKEDFGKNLEKEWLAFYQKCQAERLITPAQASAAELLADMPEDIRLEAEELLGSLEPMAGIRHDLASLGIAGEAELSQTIYLIGTSRQTPKPLNGRVHGPTSSGKSYIVETVAECFPPETVIHAAQITPQALFHVERDSLKNQFVVGGERSRKEDDDAAERTRALRELQATGKLSKLIPMKGPQGQIITQHIELDGPIAYVETTSAAKVFDEDANRCLTLFTDERPEQTKNIIKTLAQHYSGKVSQVNRDRVIRKHHAVQRLLQPYPVIVPYADRLGELLDCRRVELRRGFPQLIALIQTSTLLHQWRRDRDSEGRLLATQSDYELARGLILKSMQRLLGGGVSDAAKRFYKRLDEWFQNGTFSTTDAWRRDSYGKDAVRGWLGELFEAGSVRVVTEGKGRTATVWQLTGNNVKDSKVLPSAQEVFDAVPST
jgi:hypothetical protein